MAKKCFFAVFGCFLGIFKPKKPTFHLVFGLKFCMKMALELGKVYAKFGATGLTLLAVASLNILRCPKKQKFAPLISWLWAVILGFLSYRTIVKFFTQENMLMGDKFWNLVSHNTHYLSWKKLKCLSKMKMQNFEKNQS